MIKNLLIITSNYPSQAFPTNGIFVQEIVNAFVNNKINTTIIRPIKIHNLIARKIDSYYKSFEKDNIGSLQVISPKYFSFSNKKIMGMNSAKLSQMSFNCSVRKAIKKLSQKPDAIYSHFLYPSGATASKISKELGILAFVGVGESINVQEELLWSIKPFGLEKAKGDLGNLSGFIVNSSMLERKILNLFPNFGHKMIKLPNGVNLEKFRKFDKKFCRQELKLPFDKFILIFVGAFNHRKGVLRVQQAIQNLSNNQIGIVYLGNGGLQPEGDNILFKGEVDHDHLPVWLSAADVFVLPTLGEGSSNAILEAMACGLPILTSKGEFNDDIVDETNSIRIDPTNIEEIRKSILLLLENVDLRKKLSEGSLDKIHNFSLDVRAKKIITWMESVIISDNKYVSK